jgi:hypothetical protein
MHRLVAPVFRRQIQSKRRMPCATLSCWNTIPACQPDRGPSVPTGYGPSSAVDASGKSGWEVARSNPDYAMNLLPHVEKRRVMNSVLCVGTPPTFVMVDGVWGSVGYT